MKIIGLDVGTKRIGVAKADSKVKIALAGGYIKVDGTELSKLAALARTYGANLFVVGLPRSNDGNETKQSLYARNFARALNQAVPQARVVMQDESLTSVEAEERLKMRGRPYEKGDIDAEAATIILQDFLERNLSKVSSAKAGAAAAGVAAATTTANPKSGQKIPDFGSKSAQNQSSRPKSGTNSPDLAAGSQSGAGNQAGGRSNTSNQASAGERVVNLKQEKPAKKHRAAKITAWILLFLLVLGGGGIAAYTYLNQPVDPGCGEVCTQITFTVEEGQSTGEIAENLYHAGLVRNSLAFQAYYYLHYLGQPLKTGEYTLNGGMGPAQIIETLIAGPQAAVFSFTFLPGENIFDFRAKLLEQGYSDEAITAGLEADYDHPVLAGKPADASLEGYLYGETYEFYVGESVENIITKMLDQLYSVVQANDLENKFAAQGLDLFQGITLASIVQKEANNATDYAKVAQVFYSRLSQGISLGSDITVQYALDLVDPERTTYTDNAAALGIDSPYNTRLYTGLTPGPVSNPGESALVATANPADTDYLFFLTGDDGMMYYSHTDAEHQENIANHCQELCAVAL